MDAKAGGQSSTQAGEHALSVDGSPSIEKSLSNVFYDERIAIPSRRDTADQHLPLDLFNSIGSRGFGCSAGRPL